MFIFSDFWRKYPALLYSIAATFGIGFGLEFSIYIVLCFFVFLSTLIFTTLLRIILTFLIFFAFFGLVSFGSVRPHLAKEGLDGGAHFKISSLAETTTHFGKRWDYKGTLDSFVSNQKVVASQLPCRIGIHVRKNKLRPLANHDYLVKGTLKEVSKGNYIIQPHSEQPWMPVKGSWSLAELRFNMKNEVTAYIKKKMKDAQSGEFLAGIVTGNFEDRMMNFSFSRFGLQHIMAISGFHFAILAFILAFLLRQLMSVKLTALFLIIFLAIYMIFLGNAPSVIRAWLAISIAFMALVIERPYSSLNALGISVLFLLIYDPYFILNLGFQFSVATTASIILFYGIADQWLEKIFRKRPLSVAIEMHPIDQHGYIILTLFRKALALEIAVNIIALPVALFYFQKIPLLGFVWNLFFPFLISISMLLLLLGLLFTPFGNLIHTINNYYTHNMLNILYNPTTRFDYQLRVESFPASYLVLYMTLIFLLGIFLHERKFKKYNEYFI